jgi:MerT mercuric transport protein
MNSDTKMGLGVVALLALCCAGPLILSLLASGALLGALGAVWVGGRPLVLAVAAVLVGAAGWLLVRRRSSQADEGAACRTPPAALPRTAEKDGAVSGEPTVPPRQASVGSGMRSDSR